MPAAVANSWSNRATGVNSLAVTVSGIQSGETIVVMTIIRHSAAVTINAPTDDAGNTYTVREGTNRSATFQAVGSVADSQGVAAAPTVITAHTSVVVDGIEIVVFRTTGVLSSGAYDVSSGKNATGANMFTAPITTTQADEIIFTMLSHDGATATLTPPTGFTAGPEQEDQAQPVIYSTGYQVVSTIQTSTSYTWTNVSRDCCVIAITYKAAPPAGVPGNKEPMRTIMAM